MLRSNIDTDAIIPSREMKLVSKLGLADGLFAGWRYLDAPNRVPNPDFVLNRADQRGTSVLLCGVNFGCGSSREHAVWALKEYGIRVVIAPSFGSIFTNNCVRNGVLPMVLGEAQIAELARSIEASPQTNQLEIDLHTSLLTEIGGKTHAFSVAASHREMLISGKDPIAMTLEMDAQITEFQVGDRIRRPWIYV